MLQNFISNPWQNVEKSTFHNKDNNSQSWVDPNMSLVCQAPYRSRLAQNILNSIDNQNISSLSLTRQSLFSSLNLTGNVQINSNNEKFIDRFIPSKISSNYFSLLLSEQRQPCQKQEKNKSNSQQVQSQNQNEIEQSVTDTGNGPQQYPNSVSDRQSQTEDQYAEMLRSNIIKQLSDYQDISPSSRLDLITDSKIHQYSAPQNNQILKGDPAITRKTSKVFSYRMNIHRKNQLIQESDDIVLSTEPVESRKISSKPYKILDAPCLSGDYYTNVLDWTRQNLVVVALNSQVYTWSPVRHDINNLMTNCSSVFPQPNIVSLSSNRDGQMLAVADENGLVKIFDIEKSKVLYEFEGHSERIGAIAWNDNLLTTASKDYSIKIRDIRSKQNLSVLKFHKEQVCGIKWSEDGMNLASGGNDNKVCVYNLKMNKLTSSFSSHNGAVKALAWSPHKQNLLVSGGGNKDQTLKFWNTHTNTLIKSIHTGSQVCNMVFSKNHNEIVTTHGFQLNQVSVWRADNYSQIVTLYGHTERVLYLALSPDQEDIVTGSADETLRFWKVFNQKKKREQSQGSSKLDPICSSIR